MAEKFLLKDMLFNLRKVEQIAGEIQSVHPSFKKEEFAQDVVGRFSDLELKARIAWIAECLRKHLPADYKQAADILVKALPEPNNPDLSDDDFGDFIYAPYAEFVAKYGCTLEHLPLSLKSLYEITQRFSAEDAIRFFINAFPSETLTELATWAGDSHYHVRRLCSEGTRPKLPWSQKINIPVTAPIPILDRLYSDKTRYVTRSVANHLNDISKVDPELTLDTLKRWQGAGMQNQGEMEFIVRHSLRTLIKEGHPSAMGMLGFAHDLEVSLSNLVVPPQVQMDTALEFSFTIQASEDANVVIDYILYFQNKSGRLDSKKVFKLAKLALAKDQPVDVSKRHELRAKMTTRTLYPGEHAVEIQINGKRFPREAFMLI